MKITKCGKNWFTVKFDPTDADQAMAREWIGMSRRAPKIPNYLWRIVNPRRKQRTKEMSLKRERITQD